MNPPLVSVLMPVYNAQPYLTSAIQSILDQTYPNFEFVIIEDGSTDNSLEELQLLQLMDEQKIQLIENGTNKGIIYSLNKGLQVARGKYIARMDADDIAFKNRLLQQVQFLEQHPDYGIVGTGMLEFKEDQILRYWYSFAQDDKLRIKAIFNSPFAHPTVMIRNKVFDAIIGYDENYPIVEDYRLWLDIMKNWKIANLEQPLLYYRIHDRNLSRNKRSVQREGLEKLYQEWLPADNSIFFHYYFSTTLIDDSRTNYSYFITLQEYSSSLLDQNKNSIPFFRFYVTILYFRILGKYARLIGWQKVLASLNWKLIPQLSLLRFFFWGIEWQFKYQWYKIKYSRSLKNFSNTAGTKCK